MDRQSGPPDGSSWCIISLSLFWTNRWTILMSSQSFTLSDHHLDHQSEEVGRVSFLLSAILSGPNPTSSWLSWLSSVVTATSLRGLENQLSPVSHLAWAKPNLQLTFPAQFCCDSRGERTLNFSCEPIEVCLVMMFILFRNSILECAGAVCYCLRASSSTWTQEKDLLGKKEFLGWSLNHIMVNFAGILETTPKTTYGIILGYTWELSGIVTYKMWIYSNYI